MANLIESDEVIEKIEQFERELADNAKKIDIRLDVAYSAVLVCAKENAKLKRLLAQACEALDQNTILFACSDELLLWYKEHKKENQNED